MNIFYIQSVISLSAGILRQPAILFYLKPHRNELEKMVLGTTISIEN